MNTSKIIYIVSGILAAAGIGVGIYFIAKKPKPLQTSGKSDSAPTSPQDAPQDAPVSEQVGGGTQTNPSGCSDLNFKENVSSKSLQQTQANSRGSVFILSQPITVKGGSTIGRMGENGCKMGDVKTNVLLKLGTIWHIYSSGKTVIVKQDKSFSYPFYAMSIEMLE